MSVEDRIEKQRKIKKLKKLMRSLMVDDPQSDEIYFIKKEIEQLKK